MQSGQFLFIGVPFVFVIMLGMIQIKQITTRSQKENLNVATPKIGEIIDYSHIETYQEHWWENVE